MKSGKPPDQDDPPEKLAYITTRGVQQAGALGVLIVVLYGMYDLALKTLVPLSDAVVLLIGSCRV